MRFNRKQSKNMKTQTCAANKTPWAFVPIASFEFESFEIPVRRVNTRRPLLTGAVVRSVKVDPRSSQSETTLTPIDTAQPAKIFLPSPSTQGRGPMCLRLGARPVARPAALSSGSCNINSRANVQRGARARANRLPASQLK